MRGSLRLLTMGVALCGALGVMGAACEPKVPIIDIGAAFVVADATWFEDEQTLFLFYRIDSAQGLSDQSQIELAFRTDDVDQDFAPLAAFTPIHQHLAVSCGLHTLCGSYSLRIALPPRDVQLRLRFHKDGELTLPAPLDFHTIVSGPAHTNRSAVVYGVFDEGNQGVQWRLRHQFPATRNPDAEALGLRRAFSINGAVHGSLDPPLAVAFSDNAYGYGFSTQCPADFTSLEWDEQSTTDRAFFDPHEMPLTASTSAVVCSNATVIDAIGSFTTTALAHKNPETAPAFPRLETPIRNNTPIRYMLQTCNDIVSDAHQAMQMQRLQLQPQDIVCVDDFASPGFVARLSERFQDRLEQERAAGNDMVMVIGLNRADNNIDVAIGLEQALAVVVADENEKSSPRLSGAFVFDSAAHAASLDAVNRQVLWCPSDAPGDDLELISSTSFRSCAVQLDNDLVLGPVRVASLPILPTRRQFTTFVDHFSEGVTGSTRSLTFLAPTRTPLSENVPVADFGVATFFNNEAITADVDDSFSFCIDKAAAAGNVVFRVAEFPDEPLPLAVLPDVHAQFPSTRYSLGLAWDFPFLLQMKFETFAAIAATVVGVTIPFGQGLPGKEDLGSAVWLADGVDLSEVLLRCDRFCNHPTFDSDPGVYNVLSRFNETFRNECYKPRFPERGDGGFPIDP